MGGSYSGATESYKEIRGGAVRGAGRAHGGDLTI
jgi:hypothetical protein